MRDGSAFPTTLRTELIALVDPIRAGAAAAARRAGAEKARVHVMERYAEPLAGFVRGSSLSRLGEPAEIVNGFFASRLSDAGYLEAWARSGMRLRRWLMNGILFHGQGIARDRARAAARGGSESSAAHAAIDELEAREASAETGFEGAWALPDSSRKARAGAPPRDRRLAFGSRWPNGRGRAFEREGLRRAPCGRSRQSRTSISHIDLAHRGEFDAALVVSNDVDPRRAIEVARFELGRRIGVRDPRPRPCAIGTG